MSTRWVKVGSRTRALRVPAHRRPRSMRVAIEAPRKYRVVALSMPVPLAKWLDATVTRLRKLGMPMNRSWLCRIAIDTQLPALQALPPDERLREIFRLRRESP